MNKKYSKCNKCPAFYLLTEERKKQIEIWEHKRAEYINRMKRVRLILLGESMPANRYFYDINSEYPNKGLRYTLKKEFNQLDISDSLFLQSMTRRGIALFDCALCPLHKLENNVLRRKAATHCFLSINIQHLQDIPEAPIITLFPAKLGYLKTQIPEEILQRVVKEYSFSDQSGLKQFYDEMKEGLLDTKKLKGYKTITPQTPIAKEPEGGYGGLFNQ